MNWHRSRSWLACLFCVVVFCGFCFFFCGFCFWFLFWFVCGNFVTAYWTVQVLYQFTLEAPQSTDGHVYALINQLTLFCNMQLNVLNDLAEAMKALDGKKLATSQALKEQESRRFLLR